MFWLFKSKPVLDPEVVNWIFDAYKWAFSNFGKDVFYNDTTLITPSNKHFPDKVTTPEDVATTTFARVKTYAGMENWQCRLLPQEPEQPRQIDSAFTMENSSSGTAGTFSIQKNEQDKHEAIVTFNPELTRRPHALVATFAHELAHYLEATITDPPPGGEQCHEYATDFLAVFLGFGIFQANSAFDFQQYTEGTTIGWSYQRLGYLNQYTLVYILAVFCILKEIDYVLVHRYLKDPLCSYYKKAVKEIRANPKLVELKQRD